MTVTTYKWTIERYHRAIEAGIFDDQPIELAPLAFPDVSVQVERLIGVAKRAS